VNDLRPSGEGKMLLVAPPGGLAQLKSWPAQGRFDWTDLGWWTGTADRGQRRGLANGFYTFRGSDLLGLDVQARDGSEIGELDDLVVDLHHGEARYAVIAFDPGVMQAEKEIAVPMQQFVHARADRPGKPDRLVVDVSKADLAAMNGFDDDEWPDFNDPAYLASIDQRFQRTASTAQASQPGAASAGSSGWTPGWSSGPAKGSGWTGDVTPLRFQTLDANNDGFISRQEGRANDIVNAQWKAMDTNKDGRLSEQEFSNNAHLPNRAAR
jgi:sporulation protein YlmC with PRC-barrel domain